MTLNTQHGGTKKGCRHVPSLARVGNHIAYGMVNDVFDLAALYAMAIARGHCLDDTNKRTAHQSMDMVLALNGVELSWPVEETGQKIIALAQGVIDDGVLSDWLRDRA
ncbi:MAG: type II toxin-antitoxin system death-on-curing family toxin [Paracoccus sp. (in: a-proteobacteria)]|uniref:type II toxin-antitoxin system death-on-curing family toxin n=1 Tax=Paracoccus sp. TaxID=267 RepID=UPI0026E007C5|nr:type II toxin-antitoxin system death-on-curing family toxin [Paracoccus sp. (in: a-proteobacteria)]MDO5621128.1 type II toxin-antitoxin system death-on-curing family toxin [Paracoccus sp. (in: a-proteobacteria)]